MALFRRRRRRLPRQLKTTREGKLLIGLTLGLGFGAINSGNNLLYLVLGMMLSLIVVSGILSELSLRGVVVRRRFMPRVHAGRESFLTYELHNTKPRLRSFSVEVEEILEDEEVAAQRPAYALLLEPDGRAEAPLRIRFDRRGVYRSKGLRIATRYPFGFFRKSRDVMEESGFVVWPAVHEVTAPHLGTRSLGEVETSARVGRGGEYHGLREHVIDDDPRDIHWKTSARLGRLVSREYERPADRRIQLMVPNAIEADTEEARAAAEAGISEAASLACHYIGIGWAVGVHTLEGGIEPGTGTVHLSAVLDHLAKCLVHTGDVLARHDRIAAPAASGERLLVRHGLQRRDVVEPCDHVHEIHQTPTKQAA